MWIVLKHLSKSESKILYSEMCRKNALRRSTLYVIVRFQTLPTVYSIERHKTETKVILILFLLNGKMVQIMIPKSELRLPTRKTRITASRSSSPIAYRYCHHYWDRTDYNLYRVAPMREMLNVVIINSTGLIKDYRNNFRLQSGRLCQKNKLRVILRKNSLPVEKRYWTNGYEKSAAIQFYPG